MMIGFFENSPKYFVYENSFFFSFFKQKKLFFAIFYYEKIDYFNKMILRHIWNKIIFIKLFVFVRPYMEVLLF